MTFSEQIWQEYQLYRERVRREQRERAMELLRSGHGTVGLALQLAREHEHADRVRQLSTKLGRR